MSKAIVFGLGAIVGAVGGAVVTLAVTSAPPIGGPPGTGGLEAPSATAAPAGGTEPGRLPALPPVTPETPERSETPVVHTNPDLAPAPNDTNREDEAATRAALAQAAAGAATPPSGTTGDRAQVWRSRARAMSDWDPQSEQHQAWFAEALIDLAGDDRATAEATGYALAWAATQGRLSDAQLTALEGVLPQLLTRYRSDTPTFRRHYYRSIELDPPVEETDPAAWTAWILAQGRGADPASLGALIQRVPANQYPSVHLAFLLAISGRADAVHRNYITRLTQESPYGDVLVQAWSRDRIARIGNKVWSAQQLTAFEARLFQMDLSAFVRARGWHAVTDLALPNPERGVALLQRAADGGELNAGNRAFCVAAATLVQSGLIDGAAVQALAAKHPPSRQ